MRIDLLSRCKPLQQLQLNIIKFMIGTESGPIITLTYRREFWGKQMAACFQEAMRECSEWTKPEIELLAAMTSKSNDCAYCLNDHTAVTLIGMDEIIVTAALKNWRTAPVSEKLRMALGFVEKLTKTPEDITIDDIQILHNVGIKNEAIQEIAYVVFCFNTINRIANAFDFELTKQTGQDLNSRILYHIGYSIASLPG